MKLNKAILGLLVIGLALCLLPINGVNAQGNPLVRSIVVFDRAVSHDHKLAFVQEANGTVLHDLHIINAFAVESPKGLAKKAGVLRIDEDIVVNAIGKPGPVQQPQTLPWGIDRIDADLAWTYVQGASVKVGVLDTGIDTAHPDLKANLKGGYNAKGAIRRYADDNGHGTHVAGIIAGLNNAIGIVGVGPQIELYSIKVLDRNGSGYLSDVIEGIQWAMNNGIKVINMSFGSTSDNLSFHQAIQAAYQAGIVQIAAAGNSGGYNSVNYPAKYEEVIAVSAIDFYNYLAYFSSTGPEVDIAAPGVNIYSTYKGSSYAIMSGTSMACPHVVGVAALKLSQNPALTPDQVKYILQITAENLGLSSDAQGAGLVDAERVVLY